MRNRDFGNAMEERPHPPAPSPVQGEGEPETALSDSACWMNAWKFLMGDGDSGGSL
jgi:hypothetical protein